MLNTKPYKRAYTTNQELMNTTQCNIAWNKAREAFNRNIFIKASFVTFNDRQQHHSRSCPGNHHICHHHDRHFKTRQAGLDSPKKCRQKCAKHTNLKLGHIALNGQYFQIYKFKHLSMKFEIYFYELQEISLKTSMQSN